MSPRLVYLMRRFMRRDGWAMGSQDFHDAHQADKRLFRWSAR